jgi:PEP-CTERM motif
VLKIHSKSGKKGKLRMRKLNHLIAAAAAGVCLTGGLASASASTQIVGDVYETYMYGGFDDVPGVPDYAFMYVSNISPTSGIGAGALTNVIISGCPHAAPDETGCGFDPVSVPIGPFTVLPGKASPSVFEGDDLTSVTVTGDFNGEPFGMALPGAAGSPVSSLPHFDLDYNTGEPGVLIGVLVSSESSSGVPVPGVPEPSTWAMMLAGFAGLGRSTYRRVARPQAAGA